jgi:hypothetical protein
VIEPGVCLQCGVVAAKSNLRSLVEHLIHEFLGLAILEEAGVGQGFLDDFLIDLIGVLCFLKC